MKFLEERTTRVSLIVVLRDATAQTGPITSGVQLSIRNQPARPVLHRLGYWLFLNLSQTTQTLVWSAEWFAAGERAVDLVTLPRLRPLLEVQLTPLLTITSTSLAQGKVGLAYQQVVAASGGKTPLQFSSTTLPTGLSLDPSSGTIAGTPSAAGQTNVTLTVTDSKGSRVQKGYTLTIAT